MVTTSCRTIELGYQDMLNEGLAGYFDVRVVV